MAHGRDDARDDALSPAAGALRAQADRLAERRRLAEEPLGGALREHDALGIVERMPGVARQEVQVEQAEEGRVDVREVEKGPL